MTQPTTLPSATAQKQAAAEVFAQYEPPLYEAYLEMMLEWMAAVKTAMFAGGIARLGLVPDPMTVFSQTPKWTALTAKYTAEVARDVLAAPYRDLFADDTLFESRPFVRNWVAQRENRLNAMPDEVFGLVTHIIDAATTNGASIPDVTAQVEQLFGDTSIPTWKNRARTVARTEVVGAYNGGTYDAFSMIVANDPGTDWVKRWLATEDSRTRPDHVEADGQVVPFSQPFIIGAKEGHPGFQMMYPHDPAGPPHEVINCRCVPLLEIKNEPTKMGNRQYKDALTAGFNPAEKRAHDGKWTKGGGLLKSLINGKAAAKMVGPPPPATAKRAFKTPTAWPDTSGLPGAERFDNAAYGDDALKQFPNMAKLPPAQIEALTDYGHKGFESLNKDLEKGKASPRNEHQMGQLDAATAPATRTKDVVVWRGLSNPAKRFGKAWNDSDVTGLEWTQNGFTSSSTDEVVASSFAKEKGDVVMRILIPKSAKVGAVDMRHPSNINAHEDEALLGRSLRFRVVNDHGTTKFGTRYLDVEVSS